MFNPITSPDDFAAPAAGLRLCSVLAGYILGCVLNGTILLQIFLVGNRAGKSDAKKKTQ